MSYFYFANPLQYFTILPNTPNAGQIHPQQIQNTVITPISNLGQNPSRLSHLPSFGQSLGDSSVNIIENYPLTDLQDNASATVMDLTLAQSRITVPTTTIISSFNESKNIFSKRQQELSLDMIPEIKRSTKKQSTKLKIEQVQDSIQYFPKIKKSRNLIPQKYYENSKRNIIPNTINQIFSFLQKKDKSQLFVHKLLQKFPHDQVFTVKRFYIYQSFIKDSIGHYNNHKSLKLVINIYEPSCQNWSYEEQKFYIKINRCLIYHFLNEDSISMILTSKRMKNKKRFDHLQARRQVYQSILGLIRGY